MCNREEEQMCFNSVMESYFELLLCTVPLTRKVKKLLARHTRASRESNALLAREHSRALESTRNIKWITRT